MENKQNVISLLEQFSKIQIICKNCYETKKEIYNPLCHNMETDDDKYCLKHYEKYFDDGFIKAYMFVNSVNFCETHTSNFVPSITKVFNFMNKKYLKINGEKIRYINDFNRSYAPTYNTKMLNEIYDKVTMIYLKKENEYYTVIKDLICNKCKKHFLKIKWIANANKKIGKNITKRADYYKIKDYDKLFFLTSSCAGKTRKNSYIRFDAENILFAMNKNIFNYKQITDFCKVYRDFYELKLRYEGQQYCYWSDVYSNANTFESYYSLHFDYTGKDHDKVSIYNYVKVLQNKLDYINKKNNTPKWNIDKDLFYKLITNYVHYLSQIGNYSIKSDSHYIYGIKDINIYNSSYYKSIYTESNETKLSRYLKCYFFPSLKSLNVLEPSRKKININISKYYH